MELHVFNTDDNNNVTPIPMNIDCSDCKFNGFQINIKDIQNPDLSHSIFFTINRTTPHKIFAIFTNLIMVSVALFVIFVSIKVWKYEYAPSSNLFGFLGGLLFALPAVRGLQPQVPPLGILIDYYGFFVAELLTAIGLLIILVAWLVKPLPKYD